MADQKQSSSERMTVTLDAQLGNNSFRFSTCYETIHDHKTGRTILRRPADVVGLNVVLVKAAELLGSLDDPEGLSDDEIKRLCDEICNSDKMRAATELACGGGPVKCKCGRSPDSKAVAFKWSCENIA